MINCNPCLTVYGFQARITFEKSLSTKWETCAKCTFAQKNYRRKNVWRRFLRVEA